MAPRRSTTHRLVSDGLPADAIRQDWRAVSGSALRQAVLRHRLIVIESDLALIVILGSHGYRTCRGDHFRFVVGTSTASDRSRCWSYWDLPVVDWAPEQAPLFHRATRRECHQRRRTSQVPLKPISLWLPCRLLRVRRSPPPISPRLWTLSTSRTTVGWNSSGRSSRAP